MSATGSFSTSPTSTGEAGVRGLRLLAQPLHRSLREEPFHCGCELTTAVDGLDNIGRVDVLAAVESTKVLLDRPLRERRTRNDSFGGALGLGLGVRRDWGEKAAQQGRLGVDLPGGDQRRRGGWRPT